MGSNFSSIISSSIIFYKLQTLLKLTMETNMQPASNLPQQATVQAIPLTDTLIESLKPALVFKNFVSHFLEPLISSLVKRNKLRRHIPRWQVPRGGM